MGDICILVGERKRFGYTYDNKMMRWDEREYSAAAEPPNLLE